MLPHQQSILPPPIMHLSYVHDACMYDILGSEMLQTWEQCDKFNRVGACIWCRCLEPCRLGYDSWPDLLVLHVSKPNCNANQMQLDFAQEHLWDDQVAGGDKNLILDC
jgi:hypothetical protein